MSKSVRNTVPSIANRLTHLDPHIHMISIFRHGILTVCDVAGCVQASVPEYIPHILHGIHFDSVFWHSTKQLCKTMEPAGPSIRAQAQPWPIRAQSQPRPIRAQAQTRPEPDVAVWMMIMFVLFTNASWSRFFISRAFSFFLLSFRTSIHTDPLFDRPSKQRPVGSVTCRALFVGKCCSGWRFMVLKRKHDVSACIMYGLSGECHRIVWM